MRGTVLPCPDASEITRFYDQRTHLFTKVNSGFKQWLLFGVCPALQQDNDLLINSSVPGLGGLKRASIPSRNRGLCLSYTELSLMARALTPCRKTHCRSGSSSGSVMEDDYYHCQLTAFSFCASTAGRSSQTKTNVAAAWKFQQLCPTQVGFYVCY